MEATEKAIEAKRSEIVARMKAKRKRLEAGQEVELVEWIIPGGLGCMQRPLRHHPRYGGSGAPIPAEASLLIGEWAEQVRLEGTVSIVTFMHERDLRCYRDLDLGCRDLSSFLERSGFAVCPLPWEDPAHAKTDAQLKQAKLLAMREEALKAYDKLAKPVVLMCSAAIDRTAPAAAYIWAHRAEQVAGV